MRFLGFSSGGCLSLYHVFGNIIGTRYLGRCFVEMTTFLPVSEGCGDWKRIKCSQDELRLDVTLASGQSFRYCHLQATINTFLKFTFLCCVLCK